MSPPHTSDAPERKARALIDAALDAAGWAVQSRPEMNLAARRGVAVREYVTKGEHGYADVSSFLDRAYVATYLRSPDAQTYFRRVARGVAVKGVNIADVRATPVALAPVAEQTRIVEEVERFTTTADAVNQLVALEERRGDRLRQSILKWAFEGKLADQDPADEPASVLLERIRAERAAERRARDASPSGRAVWHDASEREALSSASVESV